MQKHLSSLHFLIGTVNNENFFIGIEIFDHLHVAGGYNDLLTLGEAYHIVASGIIKLGENVVEEGDVKKDEDAEDAEVETADK